MFENLYLEITLLFCSVENIFERLWMQILKLYKISYYRMF